MSDEALFGDAVFGDGLGGVEQRWQVGGFESSVGLFGGYVGPFGGVGLGSVVRAFLGGAVVEGLEQLGMLP